MNLVWAALLVAAAAGAAVAGMLFVRRRAPVGSYFSDGDRAAGVFGVLATGFSVLLGFVVFLAFTSYDDSRVGATTEARLLTQQFETAQFLPPAVAKQLGGELICYGRSVVHIEWPRLEAGSENEINPWAVPLFRTLKTAQPVSAVEQAAFSKWLDQTSDRQEARQDRIHGAEGIIPTPLWIVLLFTAVVILVYMFFFADSGEPAIVQATLVASVVGVLVATLLVVRFLDDPYRPGVGSLKPTAMERTLLLLDQERRIVGDRSALPCTATGAPAG